MVIETFTSGTVLMTFDFFCVMDIPSFIFRCLCWISACPGVGPIIHFTFIDGMRVKAGLLVVMYRCYRPVDRYLGEVGAVKAVELGVHVRKQSRLQQGVIGHIDARHHMSGMKGRLLSLRKKVVRVPVQHHLADTSYRY